MILCKKEASKFIEIKKVLLISKKIQLALTQESESVCIWSIRRLVLTNHIALFPDPKIKRLSGDLGGAFNEYLINEHISFIAFVFTRFHVF